MWPVSDRYLATLPRPHDQVVYLEILKSGSAMTELQAGYLQDPSTGQRLTITDGSVTASRQTIGRTCELHFNDPSGVLLPENVEDLLAPYSTEIRVWIGVRYFDSPQAQPLLGPPASDVELVPQGTFVITDIESEYPEIVVSGSDRMWYMSNFDKTYSIAKGTHVDDALSSLIGYRVPTQLKDINFPNDAGADATLPALTYDADSNSGDALHAVAQAGGWRVWCEQMGGFGAGHESTIDDPECITYAPGPGSLLLKRPKRNIGGEVFNAVVFTNEGAQSTTTVRGFALDDNPSSLTYAGRIGVRPKFAASPLLTTVDQCNKAARTELQRILGVSNIVTVVIMPMHAHDPGDVIRVTDPTTEIDDKYIIDTFTVPLLATGGAISLQCRSQVIR